MVNSAQQWRGNLPAAANLNSYGPVPAFTGIWNRSSNTNTTAAYGFPEDNGQGIFEVFAGGRYGGLQRYTVSTSGNVYIRSLTAAWNGTDGPWGAWAPAGSKPLNDLGLGLPAVTTAAAFDWQQSDAPSGAIFRVAVDNITNMPPGIAYTSGTGVFIRIDGSSTNGSRFSAEVIPDTATNTNYKIFKVLVVGGKGSRTFSVRQVFTNTDTVPVANGGTGGTTPATARTGLGLGNSSTRNVGTAAGTVAAGDDSRLGTIDGKSGGIITGLTRNAGALIVTSNDGYLYQANGSHISWDPATGVTDITNGRGLAAGGIRFRIINADASIKCTFSMSQDGNGYAANGNWVSATSGRDTKDNIQEIESPRDKMRLIKAATWIYKSKAMSGKFGIGVIADELYEAFPEAKVTVGDVELDDGSIVEDALSVQAGDSGVTVALHHATILSIMDENEAQQQEIAALKSNLNELKKRVDEFIAK